MNTKHTPGPWSTAMWTDDIAGAVGWSVAAGEPGHLVPTNTFETDDQEEAEANARLMAASPEMLQALRIAEDSVGDLSALEVVRAAILKATGA